MSISRVEKCLHSHDTASYKGIKLDPLIKHILLTLNNKGYKTAFSCQSHGMYKQSRYYYLDTNLYIYFRHRYHFAYIPELFQLENHRDCIHDVDRVLIGLNVDEFCKLSGYVNHKGYLHKQDLKRIEQMYIQYLAKALTNLELWVKDL